MSFIAKFNLMMNIIPHAMVDLEHMKGVASYCIAHFTEMLKDEQREERTLEKLERKDLEALLWLPHCAMTQMLAVGCNVRDHESVVFQTKLL